MKDGPGSVGNENEALGHPKDLSTSYLFGVECIGPNPNSALSLAPDARRCRRQR